MAKINFYIEQAKVNKDGFTPIKANIFANNKPHWKTVEKVKPRYWNSNKQRVRPNRETEPDNRHKEINTLLDELTSKANELFNYCTLNGIELTTEIINDFYAGKVSVMRIRKYDFFTVFDEYITVGKVTKAQNTTKTINTVRNILKEFQEKTGEKITFENIDSKLFDAIKEYCFQIRERKINNSYLDRIRRVLKAFLNWAAERDYYSGKEYLKFKSPFSEPPIVVLTFQEFKSLLAFKFESPKLDRVRDVFCVGCLTGLRFSDLMDLKRDHIQDGYIVKTIIKTKETLTIPIVEMAKLILEKYDHPVRVLPQISNQKFNEYIKICAKEALINQPIVDISYKGNKKIEITKPKWELITAHTSRKTFVTLSFFRGMNMNMIMDMSGHKQEKTVTRYLRIADEMKKTEMEKAWKL